MSDDEMARTKFLMRVFVSGERIALAEVGELIDLLKKFELAKYHSLIG